MLPRALLLIALLTAPLARAQAPLADPLGYLAAQGIAATEDTLDAAWIERGLSNGTGYVYAFRLQTSEGPEDRYFDATTNAPLDRAALLGRGILPKPPAVEPLSVPARVVNFPAEKALHPPKAAARIASVPEIAVPPLDTARALAEDAAREAFERGTLRLGIAGDLPEPLTRANLAASGLRDNATATTAIALRGEGALGLRLHFVLDARNAASTLRVYDPAAPADSESPAFGDTEWWSPTVWGDTAIVECDDALAGTFTIDRVLQVYRKPELAAKAAGSCELDVTCYPAWQQESLGVAGIGNMNDKDFLFCTASLLADANETSKVPFMLTANHCVSSGSQANTLEVYWLYQTTTCGARRPDISATPRTTGGAVFLAGNNNLFGSDFALLRLKQNPPSGLTWLGWETVAPEVGADVTCIHHPNGDYKRISFGGIIDDPAIDRLRPAERYHEVSWRAGVTEPGSSGSPLFLSATHRIIGQLYGGDSACSNALAPDYYGRFDVSYLGMSTYLGVLPNPFDLNGDRKIDSADMQIAINAALNTPLDPRYDVDDNGRVDATDIQLVIQAVLSFSR